jgi:hypothetical protein
MSRASTKEKPRARDTRKGRRASGVGEKGRPSLLTRPLIRGFEQALKLGLTQSDACARLRIAGSTFAEWKRRGRVELQRIDDERRRLAHDREISILEVHVEPLNSEQIFLDFLEALEKGQADFVQEQLTRIHKAARRNSWQAAAWMLERRRPDEFGRRSPAGDAPPPPPASGGNKPLGGMGIRTTEIYVNVPSIPTPTPENITAQHAPQTETSTEDSNDE